MRLFRRKRKPMKLLNLGPELQLLYVSYLETPFSFWSRSMLHEYVYMDGAYDG